MQNKENLLYQNQYDAFALKFLTKREVVLQDCEYTGIVFSDRAKSLFFDSSVTDDESHDLYLHKRITVICQTTDTECHLQLSEFSVIFNRKSQSLILKADRKNCPYFISPEYENSLFFIARKNEIFVSFALREFSKVKELLEKYDLSSSVCEYIKLQSQSK